MTQMTDDNEKNTTKDEFFNSLHEFIETARKNDNVSEVVCIVQHRENPNDLTDVRLLIQSNVKNVHMPHMLMNIACQLIGDINAGDTDAFAGHDNNEDGSDPQLNN